MKLVLLLLMLVFVGGASGAEYYVCTWGDNTTQGNITHPWQNVSYATQQATAGDTIYLFDGTWYNEVCTFANSGNATHRIILTAYNGTPTLIGDGGVTLMVGIKFDSYMTISHLTMRDYTHTIFANTDANHSVVSDCDLGHTGGTNNGYVVKIAGRNCHYNTIENCTVHDSGWNSIQLYGRLESETPNNPSTYITVKNCTVYNSNEHNAIDLYGNLQYVTIEDCELHHNSAGNIFTHDPPDHVEYVTIKKCLFHNMSSAGINGFASCENITIYDNVFRDMLSYPVYLTNCNNVTLTNNSYYNQTTRIRSNSAYDILHDDNYIHTDARGQRCGYSGDMTVRSPRGKIEIEIWSGGTAFLEDIAGQVFTTTHSGSGATWIPERYYPDRSNCSIYHPSSGAGIYSATYYNITLKPTNAYLKDVAVNHESDAADDRTNISVDSSVSTNPTWINATMQNHSHTYNVSVDGVYATQVVSDSSSIVQYQYTSSWSPHTFEFDWFSGAGFSGAPDPVNIANTTGETWVRNSWGAGSGDITDSYNVSVNSVWHNITNAYYNNTGLAAETWSNVTVWAYNNTGGISQNSISQNTQSDAATWSPSNTASYYNNTGGYAIEITTKTDATNLFSRTPTEADGNTTAIRLMVKTT